MKEDCPTCNRRGWIYKDRKAEIQDISSTCPQCKGKGEIERDLPETNRLLGSVNPEFN